LILEQNPSEPLRGSPEFYSNINVENETRILFFQLNLSPNQGGEKGSVFLMEWKSQTLVKSVWLFYFLRRGVGFWVLVCYFFL